MFSRFFVTLCSLILITSCSGNKIGGLNKLGAPEWVFDPYSSNVMQEKNNNKTIIAGVGSSQLIENGGIPFQIKQAEFSAKASIASQLKNKVNQITSEELVLNNKNENKNPVLDKKFEQKTENIVKDVSLSGVKRSHIWQDPKTNTLYVRMYAEISNEDLLKKINNYLIS